MQWMMRQGHQYFNRIQVSRVRTLDWYKIIRCSGCSWRQASLRKSVPSTMYMFARAHQQLRNTTKIELNQQFNCSYSCSYIKKREASPASSQWWLVKGSRPHATVAQGQDSSHWSFAKKLPSHVSNYNSVATIRKKKQIEILSVIGAFATYHMKPMTVAVCQRSIKQLNVFYSCHSEEWLWTDEPTFQLKESYSSEKGDLQQSNLCRNTGWWSSNQLWCF